jgi:hypothetical protein
VLPQQASSRKDPDSEREVFRSAGSAVLSWAWFVVALIVLIDLAVQGRDHDAVVTAVLVLAITGVVYACAWRPKIVADADGITVVNPVRDHVVPWAAITKVDVVNAVRVHCVPAPGATRGKILYSWAVQSSPRSARKAALRKEVASQPRRRLTPMPKSLQPPPGSASRGYGEIPEPARDALERSSAEFTAGRLAERAQHAHQAARVARQAAAVDWPEDAGPPGDQAAVRDQEAAFGPGAADQAAASQAAADQAAADQAAAAAGSPAPASPVAQWAWLSIAAMLVPLAVLVLVALL